MRAMVMQSTTRPLAQTPLVLDDIPTPRATGPFDVIVKVAAAGVCRTDLHLATGDMTAPLPLVPGHENAGWVHEIGAQVTSVSVGDPVICYPFVSTGLSIPERRGDDNDADDRRTPGITVAGGYAEYLRSTERSMIKVDPAADLALLAPLTDAGIAAYRACRRAASVLRPGDTAVVIGIGGLGHLAIQILRALTPATIVAVDTNPAACRLAIECGADSAVDPDALAGGRYGTARAALDFVGTDHTGRMGIGALGFGGYYLAVGVGGHISIPLSEVVEGEKHIEGVFVGSYADLLEVTELAVSGQVTPRVVRYPLEAANSALHDLADGVILGRAVLEPNG
jgi:NAD+-dependent secondary alcohol dehydrogenase Adh1